MIIYKTFASENQLVANTNWNVKVRKCTPIQNPAYYNLYLSIKSQNFSLPKFLLPPVRRASIRSTDATYTGNKSPLPNQTRNHFQSRHEIKCGQFNRTPNLNQIYIYIYTSISIYIYIYIYIYYTNTEEAKFQPKFSSGLILVWLLP